MKNTCKNKNCGCQKGLTTQCSPLPVCPNPQPCSYVTDARCVIYNDETLMCNESVALETGSNLNDALQDIYSKLCNLFVCNLSAVIFSEFDEESQNYTVSVSVSGGTGSYSYSWSFIDSLGVTGFVTPTNESSVEVNSLLGPVRLLQVIITDQETNCKTKQTFLLVIENIGI
jgi:hypothetical protein